MREFSKTSSPKLAAYSTRSDLTAQLCLKSSREFPSRRTLNENSSSHFTCDKTEAWKTQELAQGVAGPDADLLQRRFRCTPVLPAGSDMEVSTKVELAFQVKVGSLRYPEWHLGL